MDCVGETIPKCAKFCDFEILSTNSVEASTPISDDEPVENNSDVTEEPE